MKDIIKKIIKWFSPPTMEMEVDGKRYKLVFTDRLGCIWDVKVTDLETKKYLGKIECDDYWITQRLLEDKVPQLIRNLVKMNNTSNERENKRKESMKYYFGK